MRQCLGLLIIISLAARIGSSPPVPPLLGPGVALRVFHSPHGMCGVWLEISPESYRLKFWGCGGLHTVAGGRYRQSGNLLYLQDYDKDLVYEIRGQMGRRTLVPISTPRTFEDWPILEDLQADSLR